MFDLKLAEDISLIEQNREFVEYYQSNSSEDGTKLIPNIKCPILTSACPGWVCYAEKTHGSWILPTISRVKSAQQIMGSMIKWHLSEKLRVMPSDICHITIMPCFDKKLEGKINSSKLAENIILKFANFAISVWGSCYVTLIDK